MTTLHETRPAWYTDEDDSTWERMKAAFRRDWKQTKHDFGGNEPDLNQGVGDTVSQAAGSKPIPPGNVPTRHEKDDYRVADESAYKYGFTAYRHFGDECDWCDEVEVRLQRDWEDEAEWERQRRAIRRGWDYAKNHRVEDAGI